MKKSIAILLLGSALSLVAQEGQTWATVQIGGAMRSSSSYYNKGGLAYGLSGGHWFNNNWGLDLKALRLDQKVRSTDASAHEYMGLGSVLYNFLPGNEWNPYVAAGLGGTRVHSPLNDGDGNRLNYHLGAGVLARFNGGLTLQADLKAVRTTLKNGHHTEGLALVGLGYTWGGGQKAAPAPVAAPAPAPEPAPVPAVEPPPPPPPAPVQEAPKAAPVEPPPPPPPPAKIVLDEAVLHFANGKSDLTPACAQAIQKVAESLKAYKGTYTLVVSGYTDSKGKVAFNKLLSKRRADAVAKILVDSGIPKASIATKGMGPDKPIADNKTKEGQAKNRRVEIDVTVAGAKVETKTIETPITPE